MTDRSSQPDRMTRRLVSGKGVRRAGLFASLSLAGALLGGCEVTPQPSVGAAPGYGYTCYAGVYVCHTQTQVPVGSPCSCPGIGAPSFGRVQ
ncbi:hypothetical protein NFI95_09315 [Acetobacteraceae bacterium KSS8]|uniref:Lipoprotein n=1 Tax=Endosaccharibacter trunci TaxID=2812733 RepID=A0ABT1W6Z3_9PROT|nr:hypothetical protein [Acetobacteraceae bacterium KSS8]